MFIVSEKKNTGIFTVQMLIIQNNIRESVSEKKMTNYINNF